MVARVEWLGAAAVIGVAIAGGGGAVAAQEEPPAVSGRVVAAATGAAVEGAGVALARRLTPGIRVRSGRSQPGQILCIEFRNPATLLGGGCRAPLVIVDNVRQANGLVTLNTLPISNIHSIEALSPADAGVRYGADSGNGVIVIETVSAALNRPRAGPAHGRIYDWSLEPEPYPWARNLGTAVAANTAGLLAGYALSRPCLSYETLSHHFTTTRCGFAANAGSRLAIYVAPQIGVGYLTGRVGASDLSRGSMWRNAAAGAILSVPGIVLALTDDEDGFTGSAEAGVFMVVVGAPVASVLADRWFRGTRR